MEATHVKKNAGSKISQGKKKPFWPRHVPNFQELGFKIGPCVLIKTIHFQLQSQRRFQALQNRRLGRKFATDIYTQ